MNVAHLPTAPNIDALWERYADLMREMQAAPALLVDQQHNRRVADAYEAWRAAYLKWGRA